MFRRKIFASLITSAIAAAALLFLDPPFDEPDMFLLILFIYSAWSVALVSIYGIPCSALADKWSLRAKHREAAAFGLHILFGIAFIIPFSIWIDPLPSLHPADIFANPVTISSTLFATVFYTADRLLRVKMK